ncbi:MAG: RecB family exonuclease [Elusimicrobiota bacterium]
MGTEKYNLPRPLSHSSLTLYSECPQKYKFKYIDKIPEKPKSYFSFGSSVHTALEYFYDVKIPEPPALERVLAFYKENWISAGYKDKAQEEDYFHKGEQIITLFCEKHSADFHVPLFVEYQFDLEVDGVPVTGKIDRVDKLPDGRLSVVDYKTGKALAENRVMTDEQLTMYQLACEKLLGAEVCRLSFYHLPSLTEQLAQRRGPEEIHGLEKKIVSIAKAVSQRSFTPSPAEKKCFWCDYKPICPVFRSQAAAVPAFSTDDEISALIDRCGAILESAQAGIQEADKIKAEILSKLEAKGYARAFGGKYSAVRTFAQRIEFLDKKKILDLLREEGLYERILAPSAPKVREIISDPGLPNPLRKKLSALVEKTQTPELRVEPI